MIKRLPIRIKNRDVHILYVDAENATCDELWRLMTYNVGEGRWLAVRPTQELPNKDKMKLYNALSNRAWFQGLTSEMLCLKVTEAEGICFRWLTGKPPNAKTITENRKKRLEVRRLKQVQYRKNKQRKEI